MLRPPFGFCPSDPLSLPIFPISWGSGCSSTLLALIRSIMGSKSLAFPPSHFPALSPSPDPPSDSSISGLDLLSLLVLQGFLAALPPARPSTPGPEQLSFISFLPSLRLLPLVGKSTQHSELFIGCAIEGSLPPYWLLIRESQYPPDPDTSVPGSGSKSGSGGRCVEGPLRVLLFDVSLTALAADQLGVAINATTDTDPCRFQSHSWSQLQVQWHVLQAAANAWLAAGVDVIMSQKLIHPGLQTYLLEHGSQIRERKSEI
jgi:hypothetical protein